VADSLWHDRRTLVTGATGLLGGWLVEKLIDSGADVVCLVRDHAPRSRLMAEGHVNRVAVCTGDVTDQAALERVLGEYEVRTVFHLAAQTIVPIANRNPVSTFESNVAGTWSLLEACRRSSLVSEIIVASSDKAYGAQPVLPYSEDMPLQGQAPYDVSKSCADLIASSYAHTYGLPVCVTRCGNLFGGGDLNFNRLVPGVIRDVLRGRAPLIRSDGRFVRDYVYVEDAAGAYMTVAEKLSRQRDLAGRAYNFSLQQPITVIEMVARITAAMGVACEPEILDEASDEIREQYLDSTRAREELGWRPAVGLDEGLRRTIAWYRAHLTVAP